MDNQRHRIILNELDKKGNVTVASLVELTGASESSIRRDLVELDHQGFLKRVHGGATLIPKVTQTIEDPLGKRQLLNADEKKKIAKYAAGMIEANDVVYFAWNDETQEGRYFTIERTQDPGKHLLGEFKKDWKHVDYGEAPAEGAELQRVLDIIRQPGEN